MDGNSINSSQSFCSPRWIFLQTQFNSIFLQNHPDGVVAVKFKEPLAAKQCIEKMDGRFFDKKTLSADYYDGITNYKVDETPEQKVQREAAWNAFLEQG